MPNHRLSSDGEMCVPKDTDGCPVAVPNAVIVTDPRCGRWPILNSIDPNEKTGGLGPTDMRFRWSGEALTYTIFFENLPTATAAAQTVTITDQLDTAHLDLDTFSLGPVSFGPYTLTPPPGLTEFVSALDLRPQNNLLVKVDARLDRATGLVAWQFTSLDPTTQQLTEDPLAGFLPPNTSPPAGALNFLVCRWPYGSRCNITPTAIHPRLGKMSLP